MPTSARPSRTTDAQASRADRRRAAAAEREAVARRAALRRTRQRWAIGTAAALAVAGGATFLAVRGDGDDAGGSSAAPVVGGDLHILTSIDDALYVGGHAAVAVSRDGGRAWQQVSSLEEADAMGWAQTSDALLVGGHPGLFRSTDGGASFTPVTGDGAVPDAHALGSAGDTVYVGSPQAGLLVSEDGGATWETRNAEAGRSFMGTILVDPADPQRLLAPDMSNGLLASSDGGRSWTPLGGPQGTMAAAWDPTDLARIVVVGMSESAISTDGGRTWQPLPVPAGTSAVTFSADGQTMYTAALDGETAVASASTDGGRTWNRL